MFTLDLLNATDLHGWQSVVVAAVDPPNSHDGTVADLRQDRKVTALIVLGEAATFQGAAQALKTEEISVACLHLAPRVYGSSSPALLALLANNLDCPLVVALHSVDSAPDAEQLQCVRALLPCADAFVVMTHAAKAVLSDTYGVPQNKIRHIPFGAPLIEFSEEASQSAKAILGLTGRQVLISFGALRPGKGIDDAIAALPEIIEEHPQVCYVILCPDDFGESGEPYRQNAYRSAYFRHLQAMVEGMSLQNHVHFVRDALPVRQRIDYLCATDIFIDAEHENRGKSASATLAYAFAAGNLVIATPTPHARDLLAHGRGYLFPFRDSHALARRICAVLADPDEFRAVRSRAYAYGRGMTWEDVGLKYVELFDEIVHQHSRRRSNGGGWQREPSSTSGDTPAARDAPEDTGTEPGR